MELLWLLLIPICFAQNLEKSRSVWVEQGLLRGKIYKIDDKYIQLFRGVPYAEPPIGELRFRKPVKKARWHQELSAVEYGPPCLQFMDFHKNDRFAGENMKRESEDCLYLNVFSPFDAEDEGQLYPIVVWIHGGSFLAGSADTGIDMETVARNLVMKGVTLVTLNYRLGPLGFINHVNSTGQVEGNYGIWDQVLALEWIQANIQQLNGDPSRVTVMGESAGAAAASVLALSPRTRGLVHSAIIMSGSSMAGWAVHRHGQPLWGADTLAQYLRCTKQISSEFEAQIVGEDEMKGEKKHCNYQPKKIACLTPDLTPSQFMDCIRTEIDFNSTIFRRALAVELEVSKMVVDGDLIPASGFELVSQHARVPILTGVARKEWAHKKPQYYNLHNLGKDGLTREECEESVYRIVDQSFHVGASEKLSNATLQLIANASFVRYIDDPSNEYEVDRVVRALQQMEADIEFVAPCQKEVDGYSMQGVPAYVYSFDYVPSSPIYEEDRKHVRLFGGKPVQVTRIDGNTKSRLLEAYHGLDHAFIFTRGYSSNFEIRPFTKNDEAMSKMLTNMLTNFIKTGDPSTKRFEWPQFYNGTSQHVSIDLPPSVKSGDVHWPQPKFWNVEAEMISRYVPKGSEMGAVDPGADLTNEERVQLGAYRRAWWALWLLVACVACLLWGIVIYTVVRKGGRPSGKPYDHIVVAR